jgi:hypothetical protein
MDIGSLIGLILLVAVGLLAVVGHRLVALRGRRPGGGAPGPTDAAAWAAMLGANQVGQHHGGLDGGLGGGFGGGHHGGGVGGC